MSYSRDQLEDMTMAELVQVYNDLGPTQNVQKFRDKQSGIERIINLQALVDAAAPASEEEEEPMNTEAQEAVTDEVPEVAEEPSNKLAPGSDERNAFVATEADETTKLTNRKEEAIFHGANPNGLVAKVKAKLGDKEAPEDVAASMTFFENNASKKVWPTKSDVKEHKEVLVAFLS